MNTFFTWFRSHASAILVTAIAVSKAGLLGKSASLIIMAIAGAFGVS